MNRAAGKKRNYARRLAPILLSAALLPAGAQTVAKPPVKTPSAGGNSFAGPGEVRYQPSRDGQDRRIDMFIGDWHNSMPRHASLVRAASVTEHVGVYRRPGAHLEGISATARRSWFRKSGGQNYRRLPGCGDREKTVTGAAIVVLLDNGVMILRTARLLVGSARRVGA